jgi:dissimilatory sulfite reductase (desulfoviridin) alpha/beta subunit
MKIFPKKDFIWDEEAAALLKKVPFFVRRFAQAKVEDLVRSQGRFRIKTEDVERARKSFLRDIEQQEAENRAPKDLSKLVLYQVEACKGKALGCPFGLVDTQPLAERVIALLEELKITEFLLERSDGLLLPHHKIRVAIAGCPNGCTQPQIKDFGIIAQSVPNKGQGNCTNCSLCVESCQEGAITLSLESPIIHRQQCVNCGLCARICPERAIMQKKEGYRLLVGGRLGRHPRLGWEIVSLASEVEAVKTIKIFLDNFKLSAKPQEKFYQFVERFSPLDPDIGDFREQ